MFSANTFIRTVISGFIATFVMAMTAFIQGGLGLPVVDIGHIITGTFNQVHCGSALQHHLGKCWLLHGRYYAGS